MLGKCFDFSTYEQFSRNDSAMAPQWLSEKKFKLLKYEHIIHHLEACDLEIQLV